MSLSPPILRARHVTKPDAQGFCVDYLARQFPHISHAEWQARMAAGEVRDCKGQPLHADTLVRPHMEIFYSRRVAHEPHIPLQERIIFENDAIVVADKPHFLPVVPSGKYVRETLLYRLQEKLQCPELSPAHRIDRDTAGLVLLTKQKRYRALYQNLFRDRLVSKTYHAIAPYDARFETEQSISNWLQTSTQHFMQMDCLPCNASGHTNAATTIKIIAACAHFDCLNGLNLIKKHALYELKPITGQRHQLRAQMAALGLPILHDGIYPSITPEVAEPHLQPPLQLLAYRLALVDPLNGEPFNWQSEMQLLHCDNA